jgi:deoxyribonuclease V
MIAAVDVHYMEDGSANAGAVVFGDYSDYEAYQTYTCRIPETEPYVPGQFYKRELPCILAVLKMIKEEIDTLIIDGYVFGYQKMPQIQFASFFHFNSL